MSLAYGFQHKGPHTKKIPQTEHPSTDNLTASRSIKMSASHHHKTHPQHMSTHIPTRTSASMSAHTLGQRRADERGADTEPLHVVGQHAT